MVLDHLLHSPSVRLHPKCHGAYSNMTISIMGGALMSFLPVTNRSGCLAGIYLTNAVVAPLPVLYAVCDSYIPFTSDEL